MAVSNEEILERVKAVELKNKELEQENQLLKKRLELQSGYKPETLSEEREENLLKKLEYRTGRRDILKAVAGMGILGAVAKPVASTTITDRGIKDLESVHTENEYISDKVSHPAVTTPINSRYTISRYGSAMFVEFVDNDPNSPFPNRAFHSDYYWDPPYESGATLPGNGEGGYGPPSGARFCKVLNDYIFSCADNPLTLYRAPYSDAFGSGTFSWSTVLTGQAGSQALVKEPNNGVVGVNYQTGVMLVGEYGNPGSPKIYKSTDDGASWTTVFTVDSSYDHIHCVTADPYVNKHWIACLGDVGTKRFLESWDDGDTWEYKNFGPETNSQARGFDFGPNNIYFADDKGAYSYGAWFYNRDSGEVGTIFSNHPLKSLSTYIENPIGYAVVYDEGVVYVLISERGDGKDVCCYALGIGSPPHFLDARSGNYMAWKTTTKYIIIGSSGRYDKIKYGGAKLD